MKKQGLIAGFALAAAMALSPYAISAAPGAAIGDKVPDGTVYAGISPDTHKALYTTSADVPVIYTWNDAGDYCSALQASGHEDWRVPSRDELNMEFNHRAAIGGFNETGSYPAGWYWSSSQNGNFGAWAQRFSDGLQHDGSRYDLSSLRCVR